jgi:hypothetical protein
LLLPHKYKHFQDEDCHERTRNECHQNDTESQKYFPLRIFRTFSPITDFIDGYGMSRGNVQAAAPAPPAPLARVVNATTRDVPRCLGEIGRDAAFESITVTPQVRRAHR